MAFGEVGWACREGSLKGVEQRSPADFALPEHYHGRQDPSQQGI